MTQKKDVSKAASLIGRIEKNIQTAEKTAEKERLAGDKAETLRQNLETKKESQQQELEKLETEKLEMVEQQQLIDAEISGKQLQHNELNREGNLETKEAQRVMKDLNKLKERSAKGKAEQIKKSEAIYKAKDAISKTTTEARELEDTKKEHISKEKSKRQEVDNLRSDLDKARKKKEEEEKEMTEVIKALEGIRKAQADFSLVQ
jgi:chromosome segregation ATPase